MDTRFKYKRNKNYEITKAQTTPWGLSGNHGRGRHSPSHALDVKGACSQWKPLKHNNETREYSGPTLRLRNLK